MPLKMTEPSKHSKSGRYRVRLTIPALLRPMARQLYGTGREFTANLDTKDKREAIRRAPAALADLRAKLEAVRAAHEGKGKSLSNREVRALVGRWYKERVVAMEDNPGSWAGWEVERDNLLDALVPTDDDPEPSYEPDQKMLDEAEELLLSLSITADAGSIRATAAALWESKLRLAELMMRRAAGDYSPDPAEAMIPAIAPRAQKTQPTVPIEDILKGWARDHGYDPDGKPVPRNYYDRYRTAMRLAAFLGHSDAGRVTKADAIRWKESMVDKSPATIANDLSEMSAIWRWAVANEKLTTNPFTGILPPKKAYRKKASRRPYTGAEAAALLVAARKETGALRWLPWVLALTGARLSEVCQGVKEDIVTIDGRLFLRIHNDDDDRAAGEVARSVKNESSVRTVPIHSALVAEGFSAYVANLPAGSALFPDLPPGKLFGTRGSTGQKVMSRWLRQKLKIADKRISPAHSFRHWFIDEARAAGMDAEVRNAITGHADDRNESHRYGRGFREMPGRLFDEMQKIALPTGVAPADDPGATT